MKLLTVDILWRGLVLVILGAGWSSLAVSEAYVDWQADQDAIPTPLGELRGDAQRGRRWVIDQSKGNCLACHAMPIPEEPFHGTLGPPLHGVAQRLSEGQLRLRVVDEKRLNPNTIMPGYYRNPKLLNRVADEYFNRAFLTAQEVEDIVAYLTTLK